MIDQIRGSQMAAGPRAKSGLPTLDFMFGPCSVSKNIETYMTCYSKGTLGRPAFVSDSQTFKPTDNQYLKRMTCKPCLHPTLHMWIERIREGEVLKTNLGRYVPPRFSKVGSPELIF